MHSSLTLLCGAWCVGRVASVVLLALSLASPAFAQQDTTAPVLLEFTASPVVFDTGPSAATVEWCAKATDDLAGISGVYVNAYCVTGGCGGFSNSISPSSKQLNAEGCAEIQVPRFTKYDQMYLEVSVSDSAGNSRQYVNIDAKIFSQQENLCPIGPCILLNRAETSEADADNDGTPNDADNCPDVSNADQADRDVDLIGDACDPFPDDRDNEQAQCEADLGQSKRDGKQTSRKLERVRGELAADRADADGDGVRDATDDCPATPINSEVDKGGCSLAQFCGRVDATTSTGRKACRRSDWKNDEPLMNLLTEADCSVDGGPTADSSDDRCVSATP